MKPPIRTDINTLFEEKSLFRLYRAAPSFFTNTFNTTVTIVAGLTLTVFSIGHILFPSIREAVKITFIDTFAAWANVGAALAGTILGFLIAGFAIVCTILRPQTMLFLLNLPNEKYGMNELKLLFLTFVDVFVQYLALLLWSIIVIVYGGRYGPATYIGALLTKIHWLLPFCLLHIIFTAWGTWLIMLVLSLKSFIFNLHQSLLLSLADVIDDAERATKLPRSTT
jgi:hypothetical protein